MSFNFKNEVLSGFTLFLIALPLSIGIAIASGAPPASGIIAAVIGGIVGTIFTGSHVTINGPAAGLSIVVLTSIQLLGQGDLLLGYRLTLAAIVVAGLVQIALGLVKAGNIGLIFPTAAVHGMLCAIGAIIMTKQFHVMIGKVPESKSIVGMMGEIPKSVLSMNPAIAFIGISSLALLVIFARTQINWLKRVPGPLVAILFGTIAGLLMDLEHPHKVHFLYWDFPVMPSYLLNIPENVGAFLITPDFSQLTSTNSIHMIVTIALVASIESVLSAYAVDKIDPLRRKSNFNKDLCAKGVCTVASGMIGGLPIINEIVRSSANISSGARTRWSNFFHGVFILLFVILFPKLLHEIPLASLAAVLVIVGFRLTHPKTFRHMWHLGWDQFAVFMASFVTSLLTDVLIGVLTGFAIELALNAMRTRSLKSLFHLPALVTSSDEVALVAIKGPIVFSNFLLLKKTIDPHVGKRNIEINLRSAKFVDHTVMEHLKRYQDDHSEIEFNFSTHFSRIHMPITGHPLSGRSRRKPANAKVLEVVEILEETKASLSVDKPYV